MHASCSHVLLNDNKIGKEGGIAIAKAIGVNSTLTLFNLACNALGREGMDALRRAAKPTLKLVL